MEGRGIGNGRKTIGNGRKGRFEKVPIPRGFSPMGGGGEVTLLTFFKFL